MACIQCTATTRDYPYLVTVDIATPRTSTCIHWEFCSIACRETWFTEGQAVGLIQVRQLEDVQAKLALRTAAVNAGYQAQKEALEAAYQRGLTSSEDVYILQQANMAEPEIDASSGFFAGADRDIGLIVRFGREVVIEQTFSDPAALNAWWMTAD